MTTLNWQLKKFENVNEKVRSTSRNHKTHREIDNYRSEIKLSCKKKKKNRKGIVPDDIAN